MNEDDLTLLDDERSHLEKSIDGLSNFQDRLRHMAVDWLVLLILNGLAHRYILNKIFKSDLLHDSEFIWSVALVIYFIYYLFLEGVFGRTIGKFLNKTKLLTENQDKPKMKSIIIRAIVRLIPLQFITILTPMNRTLHDRLSNTWVVRVK